MISLIEPAFLSTAFLSVLTGIGIFLINPHRPINRIFLLVLAVIALWFFCISMAIRESQIDEPIAHENHIFWLRLGSSIAGSLPWLMQLMIISLGDPTKTLPDILRRSWHWLAIPAVIAVLAFSESFIPSDSMPGTPRRGAGYNFYFGALLLQSVWLIILAYRRMQRLVGIQRIEMQVFVLNTGLACMLVMIFNYFGRLFNLPVLTRSGPFIFLILYILTVWSVSYYKIFDSRQVLASIARGIILFGMLGLGAVGLAALFNGVIDRPYDVLVAAVGGGLMALICERPTRRWFGLDHDHRLAAPRGKIVTWARQIPDVQQLKMSFEKFLCDWCQTEQAILLFPHNRAFIGREICFSSDWPGIEPLCKEGWITPESLQRKKSTSGMEECRALMSHYKLSALIAVPLGSDSPTLILALGSKQSFRPFTYPEIQLLLDLAELMDNILAHANLALHSAKLTQLESATMMSRSLAHDLNNLTTPVATYLLHAQGRATPGTAEAEVYDAALHSVKVMHDYIRESLFFCRRLIPEFKLIDPAERLSSVIRLTRERALQRRVTIQLRCEIQIQFPADPTLFQRLALNLVNNAIDASPREGVVTISMIVRNAEQICLVISDEGAGIPAENLKYIFDPYFTTKDTGDSLRGLGLGLAICRKIADLHGAEIEVNTAYDRGTVFTVVFLQDAFFAWPKNEPPSHSFVEAANHRYPFIQARSLHNAI